MVLTPSKDYNPKDSATWRALQESDPTLVDPEQLKNYTSLKEHDPIYSEVYTPQHRKSVSPQPPKGSEGEPIHLNPDSQPHATCRSPARATARSPVADLLPPNFGGKIPGVPDPLPEEPYQSAVVEAALADSKPVDLHTRVVDPASVPLYEVRGITFFLL